MGHMGVMPTTFLGSQSSGRKRSFVNEQLPLNTEILKVNLNHH